MKRLLVVVIGVALLGWLLLASGVVEIPRLLGNTMLSGLEPAFGAMPRMDWHRLLKRVVREVGTWLPALGVVAVGKRYYKVAFYSDLGCSVVSAQQWKYGSWEDVGRWANAQTALHAYTGVEIS